MLAPDTLLNNGRYRIVGPIGRGSFGFVYEAQYRGQTGQRAEKVALKELTINDPDLYPDHSTELRDKFSYAFRTEALRLFELRHQALPIGHDYFEENDREYLVMEYIEGSNLKEELEKRLNPFDIQNVLAWADQLLDVLAYLHNQNPPLIHRDIKPNNIILKHDGTIILLDFGIAKGGLPLHTASTLLPDAYTPRYAPPEQVDGIGTQPRSDLYALGATLYRLLTNKKPPLIEERQNLNDPLSYENLLKHHPEIPADVAQVLAKAMSLHIHERPSSANEMRESLQRASRNLPQRNQQQQDSYNHTTLPNPSSTKPASSANQGHVTLTASESNHTPRTSSSKWSPWLAPGVVGGLIILVFLFAFVNWGGIFSDVSTPTPTASSTVLPTPDVTATVTLAVVPTFTPSPTVVPTLTPTPPNPDVSALIERGNALRNEGQYEQAIVAYAEAIRLEPTNADAYFGRGVSHQERGELDLAIANYRDAIRFRPDYVEAYNSRGILYDNQGQLDLAIDDYNEVIRLNPTDARTHNSRGFAYHSLGRVDLALLDYNQSIRLDPNYAWPYNNRGAAYEYNGQLDLAIADYRKAFELGNERARENLERLGALP